MWTALRCGRAKLPAAASFAAAMLALPAGAIAECTDNTGLVLAAGLPVQTIYPLGVGNSLNALLSTINTVNTAFLTNTASFVSAPGGASANQQSGGVWSRTVGGYVDTKATSTSNILIAPATTGTGTCTGTVHQEYVGSQFGFDLGTLNLGASGANLHFGVTGGFFISKSKDLSGAGPPIVVPLFTLPDGKLSVDSEVPFAGVYAVLTQGGFFADAQFRYDIYKNTLTDASNGLAGQTLDARGMSVTGNVGYNVALASNWFIEPSVGAVWSRVSVDDFTGPGVSAPKVGDPSTVLVLGKGAVQFDDISSVLGRASLRVGTSITNGTYIWQPFATASILREFAGSAKASSEVTGGSNVGSTLNIATDRVGTYGQFGLGTALVFGSSGWLSYGRVDYRTGEKVEGVNVNVGVRHQW
jgi:Autotransporter beta-domain